MASPADITGCILAGGEGRRLGGADKGLVELAGEPLVAHCLARLRPQVDALVISANRNLETYRGFGVPVFDDAREDYAGPLAGCLGALRRADTRYVVTAACDSPFLPTDLVSACATRWWPKRVRSPSSSLPAACSRCLRSTT